MAQETFTFQAEVGKLLGIVARSLYSHKEIFLRELISNASDACDKLRYRALTEPGLTEGQDGFKITLSVSQKAKTLAVADNGIGMDRDDLADILGTIARSGTQAFAEQLTGDENKDMALIGQFGVGFYSAFMVADRVDVLSHKAGDGKAWLWSSDGQGSFTIEEGVREAVGTTVTLHLKKEDKEFLDEARLKHVVKAYSDHIPIPIQFDDGTEARTLNTASAIWTRPAQDITEDQYKEFYHHTAHAFDEPWLTMHNRVEGVLSYTNLLYIPSTQPFDLFEAERKQRVKLYVNRVFITDDCEGLLPPYMRFLRGIVDSEDLSLNISREMLQNDPKLAKIKLALVKRVLGEIKKKAEKAPGDYAKFWDNFGAVLKEGLYEDPSMKDRLLALVRFRATETEGLVSLDAYVDSIKEGQESIYYISGQDAEALRHSPQLEGYAARGVSVLLLTDPVDEYWMPAIGSYREKPFKSVTQGGANLDAIKKSGEDDKKDADEKPADTDTLIAAMKIALEGVVKDVRLSERLTGSAVCLVADEGDMDINLERLLKQHRGMTMTSLRILEINARHPLVKRLAEAADKDGADAINDAAHLLLDQARITEGEAVPDPVAFCKRLDAMMEKGLMA